MYICLEPEPVKEVLVIIVRLKISVSIAFKAKPLLDLKCQPAR
jgi:hypothetical protein